jgi:hypothetical protein
MSTAIRQPGKRKVVRRGPQFESFDGAPSSHDQLVAVKKSLESISAALNAVDPNTLSEAEHATWAEQMNKVDLAIARTRNSLLEGIVVEFEAVLGPIQESTANVEAALARLQAAVDVINAVSGVLGVFEQIITLGR